MALVSWTAGSGNWSTASNWKGGVVPLRGDDVSINTTASSATVTYSTGTLTVDSLTTGSVDGLDVTAGALTVENGYSLNDGLTLGAGALRLVNGGYGDTVFGSILQSGGAMTLVGGAYFGQLNQSGFSQTAGTLAINGGRLFDYESTTTLGGTIAGNGVLIFENQDTAYLTSKVVLNIAGLQVAGGGTLNLQSVNLTYANNFQLGGGGTLSLNNDTLTLTGMGALYGAITNGGTVVLANHAILNGLTLNNGSVVSISGTANETGPVTLGSSGVGDLGITATGTLRMTGNDLIQQGSSGGTLVNLGLITKLGGSPSAGAALIETQIFDATGTITAAVGTVELYGPNNASIVSTIGSSLTGGGTIEFAQGYYTLVDIGAATTVGHMLFAGSANVTLSATGSAALSYGGNWQQTGGLLLFNNSITLDGAVALDGGEMKGTGTVALGSSLHLGSGMDLEGNLSFLLNGPVTQTGTINLGLLSDSVDQATLSAGNSWALEGPASISGAYGTITDLGTFVRLDGAQNSIVASAFTDEATRNGVVTAAGTVTVDTGTLTLSGHGTLGGTVNGGAVLDIGGAFVLDTGLSLSVGEFIVDSGALITLNANVTYANDLATEGGTIVLDGNTLTLTGVTSLIAGALANSGEVIIAGPAVIGQANGQPFLLSQGADLLVSGATQQAGNLLMSSGATSPTLTVGTGGVYTVDPGLSGGTYIGSAPGNGPTGALVVQGTLQQTGLGTLQLNTAVVDNGSISIKYGHMQFMGPLSGAGSIVISAGGTLEIDTTSQVANAITFGTGGGAGGVLQLDYPTDFAGTIHHFGTGDVIALNGFIYSSSASYSVSGADVNVSDGAGHSTTLTFGASVTGSLLLGEGPTGQVALIHL